MGKGTYLVLDYGTTALKVLLFDRDFQPVGQRSCEFTYTYPQEGFIEFEAERYFTYALDAMAGLLAETGSADSLRAVSVTGQAETIIPVDRDNRPLCPALVWIDTRAGEEVAALERVIGRERFYAVTGIPNFDPVLPLGKLPWLRKHAPEVYGGTDCFLLLHDFVQQRLTGLRRSEPSVNACCGYFDIRSRDWSDELLAVAGLRREQLPSIAPPDALAPMLPEVAARLGLPRPVPVVNGMLDQCASALGAGNWRPGGVCETTGTVLAIAATLPAFTPRPGASPAMQVLNHGLADRYLALPYCPTAGMALKWFRDNFLFDLPDGYRQMDDEIERRGFVENAVVALPHFCGCTSPYSNPDACGVLYGLSLGSDRVDIARAIMEGVAFLLRENLEMLRDNGIACDRLVSLGGGANSRVWLQMKADITGCRIDTFRHAESTSLGCALGAALAIGDLRNEEEFTQFLTPGAHFCPDEAHRTYYEQKYRVYLDLNRRLGFAPQQ